MRSELAPENGWVPERWRAGGRLSFWKREHLTRLVIEGVERTECFLKTVFLKEAVGFVRLARQIGSFHRYYEVPAICYKTEETIEANSYMLWLRERCCWEGTLAFWSTVKIWVCDNFSASGSAHLFWDFMTAQSVCFFLYDWAHICFLLPLKFPSFILLFLLFLYFFCSVSVSEIYKDIFITINVFIITIFYCHSVLIKDTAASITVPSPLHVYPLLGIHHWQMFS